MTDKVKPARSRQQRLSTASSIVLLAIALLLLLSLETPVAAQSQILPTPDRTVRLLSGSSRLIRFSAQAQNVIIGNPRIADVAYLSESGRVANIVAKRPGFTDLYALDLREEVLAAVRIEVREDETSARALNSALGRRSSLSIDYADETAIVRGEVDDIDGAIEAEALRRNLSKPIDAIDATASLAAAQVNLRVRFAEISRNDIAALGVDLSALADIGSFTFGIATGGAIAGSAIVGRGLRAGADSFGVVGAGISTSSLRADALIDALASTGVVEILAEPTLTAISGRPARFEAGGQFPIIVPQGEGTFTTEFRSFGVSLDFTPTVLPGRRIALYVAPSVSSLDFATGAEIAGTSVPGLRVRQAQTTVELGSGQTLAIAGLFQRELSDDLSGVAGLQDVPIIGALLRSRRFQRSETELIILITPYLVDDKDAINRSARSPGRGKLAGFILR